MLLCIQKKAWSLGFFSEENIELEEGVFFPQRRRFRNNFVARESGHDGENFLK